MTLHILKIPDDQQQWASWLEKHIVGLHLAQLIEELKIIRDVSSSPVEPQMLEGLLNAAQLDAIVESGLQVLDLKSVQALMMNPDCLLELQDYILQRAGTYWSGVARTDEVTTSVKQVKERMASEIGTGQTSASRTVDLITPPRKGRFRSLLVSTAVVLLIGVTMWFQQPSPSGQILGQPGLTANNVNSSTDYFNRLAEAGQTWFDQSRGNSNDLVVLLQGVSNDCQILINAPHEALSAEERAWFVLKCQNWKTKFDETLAALESGQISFDDARAQADQTMMKLVQVLREGSPSEQAAGHVFIGFNV
jgi:hypothetical protein